MASSAVDESLMKTWKSARLDPRLVRAPQTVVRNASLSALPASPLPPPAHETVTAVTSVSATNRRGWNAFRTRDAIVQPYVSLTENVDGHSCGRWIKGSSPQTS